MAPTLTPTVNNLLTDIETMLTAAGAKNIIVHQGLDTLPVDQKSAFADTSGYFNGWSVTLGEAGGDQEPAYDLLQWRHTIQLQHAFNASMNGANYATWLAAVQPILDKLAIQLRGNLTATGGGLWWAAQGPSEGRGPVHVTGTTQMKICEMVCHVLTADIIAVTHLNLAQSLT